MHPTRLLLSFGIVRRLRIAFLTILIVLSTSMIFGFQQLLSLHHYSGLLTQTTVPVFARAAELERNMKNLLVLLQRVDSVNSLEGFAPLDQAVQQQIRDLFAEISGISGNGPPGTADSQMLTAFNEIEATIAIMLDTKQALLAQKQRVDAHLQTLEQLRALTGDLLERLSFSVSDSIEGEFVLLGKADASTIPETVQAYHLNLVQANALTEMTIEIKSALSLAAGLSNLPSIDALTRAEAQLRHKIRGVAVLLGHLGASPARRELADAIIRFHELVFGPAGMSRAVTDLMSQRADLAELQKRQYAPIATITSISGELTQRAREQVAQSGQTLAVASERLVTTMILSAVLTLLVVACALYFVVERQIGRRMAKLTQAVLAIAEGKTGYEVDVRGPDELGRMARALEVFKDNAQELKRSNTDLENFAYVAAHDLRSPLRAIQDLTDWTLEDPDTVLSAEGQQNMGLLQQRIGRLNQLLSDLLEYSRIGKDDSDLSLVSVQEIVQETAGLLDPEDHYAIRYRGTDAKVLTFGTPLRHAMLNLISNAIKHHDRPSGQILVQAALTDGLLKCVISDDGPGIAGKYHDRIFNLFQTLRPRDEVEGSGLGLSIIRKLIEHHGGSIRVRSDPSLRRGTAFEFELPGTTETNRALSQAA